MQIEICTNSFRSAKIAAASTIDRVELCQSLESGGITPSAGDILQTVQLKEKYDFQVYVLIRARGGDFCFSEEEYAVMEQDILFCKKNGVDGVVLGGLQLDGHLAIEPLQKLVAAAQGMGLTFHRAFDLTNDPFAALEQVIELGFERILSSGTKPTAWEGRVILKQLIEQAQGRISIMPGSGVNVQNAKDLIAFTKAQEIHFSAKEVISSPFQKGDQSVFEGNYWLTSADRIAAVKQQLEL